MWGSWKKILFNYEEICRYTFSESRLYTQYVFIADISSSPSNQQIGNLINVFVPLGFFVLPKSVEVSGNMMENRCRIDYD